MLSEIQIYLITLARILLPSLAVIYAMCLWPVLVIWLILLSFFLPLSWIAARLRNGFLRDGPRRFAQILALLTGAHGLWIALFVASLAWQYGFPFGYDVPALRLGGGMAVVVMAVLLLKNLRGAPRYPVSRENESISLLVMPVFFVLLLTLVAVLHLSLAFLRLGEVIQAQDAESAPVSFFNLPMAWFAAAAIVILFAARRTLRRHRSETGYGERLSWRRALPRLFLLFTGVYFLSLLGFFPLMHLTQSMEQGGVESPAAVYAPAVIAFHLSAGGLLLLLAFHARGSLRLRIQQYHTGGLPPLLHRLAMLPFPDEWKAFRDPGELKDWLESLEDVEVEVIGASRQDHPLYGICFGSGERQVSIVAGSHADEPLGPMTAQALPLILKQHFPELLDVFRFHVVPQINPDGAEKNRPWFGNPPVFTDYAQSAVREQPGDDIEFGFGGVEGIRPECAAAMDFLDDVGPYAAHFSLHGMPFAEGAWYLICREWMDQAGALMDSLEELSAALEMPLHDIDRKGEKGFTRIRPGFSTTPTATAMDRFFRDRDQEETAALFRPSSMEFVQSLGGDPLCMVSEIPLFLLTDAETSLEDPVFLRFRKDLETALARPAGEREEALEALAADYGATPVSLTLQMKLQVAILVLALRHLT